MLNLSCLFGTVLLCCMLSYNGVLPAHSAWRATAAGSPWGLAGASPRAGRPGQPPAAALPAAGISQPGRAGAMPRPSNQCACACPAPIRIRPPFQRRSSAVPATFQGPAGTVLPEQLLEQLPERSRKRHAEPENGMTAWCAAFKFNLYCDEPTGRSFIGGCDAVRDTVIDISPIVKTVSEQCS